MNIRLAAAVSIILLPLGVSHAQTPLGTAFTYQGQLKSGGSPASGSLNMVFKLFDAATIGNQVGPTLTFDGTGGNPPPVTVASGLFTVQLDFGGTPFGGNKRWLEIAVNGTTLAPRQELSAAPNALFALNAAAATNATQLNGQAASFYQNAANLNTGTIPDARLSGFYSSPLAFTDGGNTFVGTFSGSGSGLTGLNAGSISQGLVPSAFGGTGLNTSAASTGSLLYTSGVGTWSLLPPGSNTQVLTLSGGVPVWAASSGGLSLPFAGTTNVGLGSTAFMVTNTGIGYSVVGQSDGSIGTGVFGNATATAGAATGVYGQSASANGYGVYGFNSATTGTTFGGSFQSNSTSGRGVYGGANATTGANYGGFFESASTSGIGVYGRATATSGSNYGVYGTNASGAGYGVYGTSSAGTGGGVFGEANVVGIAGHATGSGSIAYSVYGYSTTSGYSGYFDGRVHVGGVLDKGGGSFKIDHPLDPENKYLYHSFVESPDMKNIYDGVVTTDAKGYATVAMPNWFEPLNRDFRYQLTVIDTADSDDFVQAKVVREVQDNKFKIRTSRPDVQVSWQVTGIRHDAFANAHRIPVEEAKKGDELGQYLYPGEHGQPIDRGIDYQRMRLEPPRQTLAAARSTRVVGESSAHK